MWTRTRNLAVDVDRHCESNLASLVVRSEKLRPPRCTPPGAFAHDHGLAAGLLARRSWSATAFPRAKALSGIVVAGSLLTVAGAAVGLRLNARPTFPFDPSREPPIFE